MKKLSVDREMYSFLIISILPAMFGCHGNGGIYQLHFDEKQIRVRRDKLVTPTVAPVNTKNTITKEDDHKYYVSRYYEDGARYFVDLRSPPSHINVFEHKHASQSHRKAYTVPIDFQFMYYGNIVDKMVITTGGFINIGPKFHTFIHMVHYIAPLMADFNPSANNDTKILIGKSDGMLIVQWTDMALNGSSHINETFTFQVILHRNGTIVFAYGNIPFSPTLIRNTLHEVTVGFADGFIITYHHKEKGEIITHNFIYTYHKVKFPLKQVKSGAAYKLDLLPNCVQFTSCGSCINSTNYTPFTCKWCSKLHRCSDSLDWNRDKWLSNNCHKNAFDTMEKCQSYYMKKEKKSYSGAIIGGLVGMLVFILLIIGLCLLHYSYTHPLTKSGMWLIEHHPKRLKKRNVQEDMLGDEALL